MLWQFKKKFLENVIGDLIVIIVPIKVNCGEPVI